MKERDKGPVEILCKEIGVHFDHRMETLPIFVGFVRVLTDKALEDFEASEQIKTIIGLDYSGKPMQEPDDATPQVRELVDAMFRSAHPIDMIERAARVHELARELNPEDAYPTNHYIDMLSSCASAIRFGLETPCRSRHAAEAAGHIWRRRYRIGLEDGSTEAWQKDWARQQLDEALLRLALSNTP